MQQISRSPLLGTSGLMKAICLPGESPPSRFPSFPTLERTAVMSFNVPQTTVCPAGSITKFALTRQAAYPAWATQPLTNSAYVVGYVSESAGSFVPSGSNFLAQNVAINSNVDYAYSGAVTANSNWPGLLGNNGGLQYPIVGVDAATGPMPFFYVPNSWYLTLVTSTGSVNVVSKNNNVSLEMWVAPGETYRVGSMTAAGTAGTFGCSSGSALGSTIPLGVGKNGPADGYWVRPMNLDVSASGSGDTITIQTIAFVVTNALYTIANSATACPTISVTGGSPTYAFLPATSPGEFLNSAIPWSSTRLTATSMLGTNVTQVLNKSGTLLGGRIAPSIRPMWSVTQSIVNNLHPAEKAFLGLENGFYTYLLPSGDLSAFFDYTLNFSTNAYTVPVVRLDDEGLSNVFYLTPASGDETFALTVSYAIEFRSNSALFPLALSAIPLEALHQAQLRLSQHGFFFNNQNHAQVLKRAIVSFTPRAILSAKPRVGRSMGALVSAFRRVRVQNPPRRRPKGKPRSKKIKLPSLPPRPGPTRVRPTTAQGSGIVKRRSGLDMYLQSRRVR